MSESSDACLRCGASLSFIERFGLENAVDVPGRGSLCPNCYRELSLEEYDSYFKA
ncbi:MAG: hypothetical protein GX039_08630 [Clostridia bacterium]|nr:hypothetical protein [Clostridia bacterium]